MVQTSRYYQQATCASFPHLNIAGNETIWTTFSKNHTKGIPGKNYILKVRGLFGESKEWG